MTEDEARLLVASMVDGDGVRRLERLIALVLAENERQNLVGKSTVAAMWARHVLDSVQLLRFAGPSANWLDIGTGGGFPGLAIAAAEPGRSMILVEPRRRRADFLVAAADDLGLEHVTVRAQKVEQVRSDQAAVISARAVASIEKLLQASNHCATPITRWLFPRGQFVGDELDRLRGAGIVFHVEQSLSDPASSIVIVEHRP